MKLLLFAATAGGRSDALDNNSINDNLASYRRQQHDFLLQEGHRDTHTSMKTMLEGTYVCSLTLSTGKKLLSELACFLLILTRTALSSIDYHEIMHTIIKNLNKTR